MTTQIERIEWQADSTKAVSAAREVNRALGEQATASEKASQAGDKLDRVSRELGKLFGAAGVRGTLAGSVLDLAGEVGGLAGAFGPLGAAIGVAATALIYYNKITDEAAEKQKLFMGEIGLLSDGIRGQARSFEQVTKAAQAYIDTAEGLTPDVTEGLSPGAASQRASVEGELTRKREALALASAALADKQRELNAITVDPVAAEYRKTEVANMTAEVRVREAAIAQLREQIPALEALLPAITKVGEAELLRGAKTATANKAVKEQLDLMKLAREASQGMGFLVTGRGDDVDPEEVDAERRAEVERERVADALVAQRELADAERQRMLQQQREIAQTERQRRATEALNKELALQAATYVDLNQLGTSALMSIGGSAVDTFNAIIFGSENAGQALLRLMSDAILAIARESAVRAAFHAAAAIASAAVLDFRGAALHGAASAQYAAIAVGTGIVGGALAFGAAGANAGEAGSSAAGARSSRTGADAVLENRMLRDTTHTAPVVAVNFYGPVSERGAAEATRGALREAQRYRQRYAA